MLDKRFSVMIGNPISVCYITVVDTIASLCVTCVDIDLVAVVNLTFSTDNKRNCVKSFRLQYIKELSLY